MPDKTHIFAELHNSGESITITLTETTSITFIWCAPGNFLMGSSDIDAHAVGGEKPQHRVIIENGFWMTETPITESQWVAITGNRRLFFGKDVYSRELPVKQLEWYEAVELCATFTTNLRKRGVLGENHHCTLPTEKQWEYACRAGSTTPWYFGSNPQDLKDYGWYSSNSGNKYYPVKLKKPNQWGFYDMYGNVGEWCSNGLYTYPTGMEVTLREEQQVKMARGGSLDDSAESCRSASRGMVGIRNTDNRLIGLRVVCETLPNI